MARYYKFVGNGKNDPTVCKGWGMEFVYNQPVEVNDPHVIGKLEGNSHFEEVYSSEEQKNHRLAEITGVAAEKAKERAKEANEEAAEAKEELEEAEAELEAAEAEAEAEEAVEKEAIAEAEIAAQKSQESKNNRSRKGNKRRK